MIPVHENHSDKHNVHSIIMVQVSATEDNICACPGCDLLVTQSRTSYGNFLACPRCNNVLHRPIKDSIDKTLALSATGLLLYLPALFLPLLTMESLGMTESANVIESIISFFKNEYYVVAIMLTISAALFPLILLGLIFTVALQLKMNKSPRYLPKFFKYYLHLQEWGMVEVYLLGIVITIIKMSGTADISYDPGFYCFLALVLSSMGIAAILDKQYFWNRIAPVSKIIRLPQNVSKHSVTKTAKNLGLITCHDCHNLLPVDTHDNCPRCQSELHQRKPKSISLTWALVLTSILFFLPANLLPIMQVDFLGIPDRSTILDGIIYFFNDGSYFIGVIILTASILVPMFKVIGLVIILITVKSGKNRFLKQKAKMFRFIEFIGRWSMLDIFVIALLTVLVDFGFFTSIHVAPAATYFCIVVVCTMFAAITFDPRIMWDKCTPNPGT